MKLLRYFLFNGIFVACLWLGMVEHIDDFKNVALAIAWFTFAMSICSSLVVWNTTTEELSEMPSMSASMSVPPWIDGSFDFAVVLFLMFHGYFVTGAAYTFSSLVCMGAYMAIEKAKKSE